MSSADIMSLMEVSPADIMSLMEVSSADIMSLMEVSSADIMSLMEVSSADIRSLMQSFLQVFAIHIHDLLLCQNPKGTICSLVFLAGISNEHKYDD